LFIASRQPLCKDVDNNNWLDDTSDGPVSAVLVYEDDSREVLPGSAWVVVTDPAYAPQTLNVVSVWDDVYNTWLENFGLRPDVYRNGAYNTDYKPHFATDVFPTLNAAHMQRWNTNLPDQAIKGHERISALGEGKPNFDVMKYIRNPDGTQKDIGSPLMPLSLGDANQSFLTVSKQQYFFLQQWAKGLAQSASPDVLGPGEQLDKNILVNCLGGRFSPGIEMTFIVRDPNLFNAEWKNPATGPFRVNADALDYSSARKDAAFLGVGYTPFRNARVQPGDLCKFMAIPWHTDYNSCATHTPAPNPGGAITEHNLYSGDVNTQLFWSWPSQRPVAVYTFQDLSANEGDLQSTMQRFSVRGPGTAATEHVDNPGCPPGSGFDAKALNVGRYQDRRDMLMNWQRIGIVIQGPAIDGYPEHFDPNYYLEVQSLFEHDYSNLVVIWPNSVDDEAYPARN
jgi:hypothetical protein